MQLVYFVKHGVTPVLVPVCLHVSLSVRVNVVVVRCGLLWTADAHATCHPSISRKSQPCSRYRREKSSFLMCDASVVTAAIPTADKLDQVLYIKHCTHPFLQ